MHVVAEQSNLENAIAARSFYNVCFVFYLVIV